VGGGRGRALDFLERYCGHWRTGWSDWSAKDYLDLDKAWEPLSSLLTGDSMPVRSAEAASTD
jgi:hypothetical protein